MFKTLILFPKQLIGRAFASVLRAFKGPFLFVNDYWTIKAKYNPEMIKIRDLIRQIANETDMLLGEWEALQLYLAVTKTSKIEGAIAEVGVYRGASAKLLCEANKTNKKLHLFDTFEGLPTLNQVDDPKQFYQGQFSTSYESVKKYLSAYPNIELYKGLFPSTAGPITNEKFSFVHLDVDLYEATLASLTFFYPRLNKGGMLISHDYVWAPGVRKAFHDFFLDKPEPILEIDFLGSQCLIVKM